MAGFSDPVQGGVAGTSTIDDDADPSVLFESTDGKDYIEIDTTDGSEKLILAGGGAKVGINQSSPDAPLHIIGAGGDTGSTLSDPDANAAPTLVIENGGGDSKDRCTFLMNADGANGSIIDMYRADNRRMLLQATDTTSELKANACALKVSTVGNHAIYFSPQGTERLRLTGDGKITTGDSVVSGGSLAAQAGSIHVYTGNSTQTAVYAGADDLILEGDDDVGITFCTTATKTAGLYFNKGNGTASNYLRFVGSSEKFEFKANTAGDFFTLDGSTGRAGVGATAPVHRLHVQDGDLGIVTNSADAVGKSLIFTKSRNATDGSATVVQDDDVLGNIEFQGAEDGDSWASGAKIFARVNGTPGDGDMPTELVLGTSPDGSETVAECQIISQDGSTNFMQGTTNWYLSSDNTGNTPRFQVLAQASNTTLETKGSADLILGTADARRMTIKSGGQVAAGSAAPINNKEFEVNDGTNYYSFDVGGTDSYIVSSSINSKYYAGGASNYGLQLNKYGAHVRWSLGKTDASIANDATGDVDANSSAYLADSGATLIIDFVNGGCGQVTLTADVTAIKFYNAPKLGLAQTMTVKITNDDPARTVSYSTVNIYSDAGSTTKNGSLLWAGGVAPTLSTGVGDIDIVQFTCIATSDTDRDIYGAVIGQNFS